MYKRQPPEQSYIRGLINVLIGIRGHVSELTVTPTLASFIVSHGSRFDFSHGFAPLLLSQMMAFLNGEDIQYTLHRKSRDGIYWKDIRCNDYLYRSDELENFCFYEFTMLFESCSNSTKKKRKIEESTEDNSEDVDIRCDKMFKFLDDHPGVKF